MEYLLQDSFDTVYLLVIILSFFYPIVLESIALKREGIGDVQDE
jgi:hypothetical protein